MKTGKRQKTFMDDGSLDRMEPGVGDGMLPEMALVGYFTAMMDEGESEPVRFKVSVNGGEGEVPHMHILDDDTDGSRFHTCLCLSETEYYHHSGDEDLLTQEQKEHLVEFLKSECRKNRRYKTHWEYALSMWNDNNTDKTRVDESSGVLDYTLLNPEQEADRLPESMEDSNLKDIF